MKLQEHKKELLKDPEFKKEWEKFDLWFEIQQKWLELRGLFKLRYVLVMLLGGCTLGFLIYVVWFMANVRDVFPDYIGPIVLP